jgi:hypothetical protein
MRASQRLNSSIVYVPSSVLSRHTSKSKRGHKGGSRDVFFQTTPTTEEGGRFQSFYPVDTWPFFAIIDPRTGEKILWFSETDPNVVYASLVDFLGQRPNPEAAEDEGEVEKKQPSASVSAPGAAGKVNPDVVANAVSGLPPLVRLNVKLLKRL